MIIIIIFLIEQNDEQVIERQNEIHVTLFLCSLCITYLPESKQMLDLFCFVFYLCVELLNIAFACGNNDITRNQDKCYFCHDKTSKNPCEIICHILNIFLAYQTASVFTGARI